MCADTIARMYEGITLEEGISPADIAHLQQIHQEEEKTKAQPPKKDDEE